MMKTTMVAAAAATLTWSGAAFADSIDPTSFGATLGVGDSVTLRKTVTVEATGPTDALVDIMFVFDTTGSMGGLIDGAKSAAGTILSTLSATYGDVSSGVGYYADPGYGIVSDLSTTASSTTSAINSLYACYGSCGGDGPELGNAGIDTAANDATWRPGSNRFIVAFGDAPFKDSTDYAQTNPLSDATVTADLAAANVKLFGLDVGYGGFTTSLTELGGTAFPSGTGTDAIISNILAAISTGFATYSTVTVDDLGGGLPEIDVSTSCVSADIGSCVGSDAVGSYDRSVDRTFEFDVTFTRTAAGDSSFETYALVDGGIVAREADRFDDDTSVVPLPATGLLLLGGIGGLGALRLRRKKAA